jgi:aspartate dehydrogenase
MIRLGIIGFGNISTTLLTLLKDVLENPLEHLTIVCRPKYNSQVNQIMREDFNDVALENSITSNIETLINNKPNLVVECAGHDAVTEHIAQVLSAGFDTVVASVGALADAALVDSLYDAADKGKARLIIPAGAIGGVDLLASLKKHGKLDVSYRGIKPPAAWSGTLAAKLINLDHLSKETVIFSGSAREAASNYPKNANVAATIALAGAGFEATKTELVADPKATGNIHEYSVDSPLAHYTLRVESQPSSGNAKTSVTTVYSLMREITNRIGPIVI